MIGSVGAVREEDRTAIVIHVRVADASAFGVENHGFFACAQIVAVERSGVGLAVPGIRFLVYVIAIIPDVRIPMTVRVLS